MEQEKNKKSVLLIIGIIVFAILVIVLLNNKNQEETNIINNNEKVDNRVEETNLKEFIDEAYGISFKYSKELQKPSIGNYSELNLEHPKVAGSKFFFNSPDTPNISYNKESEIQQYIQTRTSFGTSQLIKNEETTISKNEPIQCTFLEFVTGQYTEYIYVIPHRAGLIYIGITFPTGEPIQEFNDIIDSIIMN